MYSVSRLNYDVTNPALAEKMNSAEEFGHFPRTARLQENENGYK